MAITATMEIKSNKQTLDPTTFLNGLVYGDVRKLDTPYEFSTRRPDEAMRPMTYAVADKEEKIVTFFMNAEGIEAETTNTAKPGDIIISGASGELYVNTSAKFAKNYTGGIGGPIVAEQTPRKVARVPQGTPDFSFLATWGEPMPSRAGDLIVKETGDEGKMSYYRVREADLTSIVYRKNLERPLNQKLDGAEKSKPDLPSRGSILWTVCATKDHRDHSIF